LAFNENSLFKVNINQKDYKIAVLFHKNGLDRILNSLNPNDKVEMVTGQWSTFEAKL